MRSKKILFLTFPFLTLVLFFIVLKTHESFSLNNENIALFTQPYLKFDAETEISAPLNLGGSLRFLNSGYQAELKVEKLSQNQTYTLPNASGKICLLSQISPDRLVKFKSEGFSGSSIEDFSSEVSITIDAEGNVGIGTDTPEAKLHVLGKIQASDDVCTSLMGGKCLSDLEKLKSLAEATVQGEGTLNYIPIWKEGYKLGDSIIYQSGTNVGIGTRPVYKLDVAGTIRVLGFRMPVSPKKGYALISDEEGFGTWQPVLTPLLTRSDVAERFLIDKDCKAKNNCPESGDLVSIVEGKKIVKAFVPYDKRLIGVVSENPAITLGSDLNNENSRAVALVGRVFAKVSLKNGEIEIGDFLTSSEIEGVAQKATKPGRVIGIALESLTQKDFEDCQNKKVLDCKEKIGKIEILVTLTKI